MVTNHVVSWPNAEVVKVPKPQPCISGSFPFWLHTAMDTHAESDPVDES